MEEGYILPLPKGLCPECLSKMEVVSADDYLMIYCPHNLALASMEMIDDQPSGRWGIYCPVEFTPDWKLKVARMKH